MDVVTPATRSRLLAGAGAVIIGAAALGGTWAIAAPGDPAGSGTRVTQIPACAAGNDGQLIIFQTAPMADQGVTWRLRCRAAAPSTRRWEFVGGPPMIAEVEADETIAAATTTYADTATIGPSLTAPAAGDYAVTIGFRGYPWAVNQTLSMSYQIGATPASDDDATVVDAQASMGNTATRTRKKTIGEGQTLTAKYKHSNTAADGNFAMRFMEIVPIALDQMTTSGAVAPANSTAPTIAGTPRVGATLIARPGLWSNTPTAYRYQWQRTLPGGTYDPIEGADQQTYVPTEDDYSYTLRVQVSASNAAGSASATTTDYLIGSRLVSSFPANPEDGQLATYQSAAMAAQGVEWEFMYNATSTSPYKWEFVGGAPLAAEGSGPGANTNTSYSTGTTNIPSVAIPLAGDYRVQYSALGRADAQACYSDVFIAPHYGGTMITSSEFYMVGSCSSSIQVQSMSSSVRPTFATAGSNLDLRYRIQQASRSYNVSMMRIAATPIRVG